MTSPTALALVFLLAVGLSVPASAQSPVQPVVIGTFHWQLHPSCSTLSVTVIQEGANQYRVQGFEACANESPRPVHGVAAFDGVSAVTLTIHTSHLGAPTIRGHLSLATLSGTWSDDGGRLGNLVLVPGPLPQAGNTPPRSTLGSRAFLHIVSAGNRPVGAAENVTCLNHPLANGNPAATIQVTVNRGTVTSVRPIVGSTISLYYDNNGTGLLGALANNVWCISKDDSFEMPLGAAFNIRIDVQ